MTTTPFDTDSPEYRKAERLFRKTTKNRHQNQDWTPFRAAEKKYKALFPPPDLSQALDLATTDLSRAQEISHGIWCGGSNIPHRSVKTFDGSAAFIVPHIPGLVILPSFLHPSRQRDLIKWALCDQARGPNPTNLDTHYYLPSSGLWNTYLSSREEVIRPHTPDDATSVSSGPRPLINNAPASVQSFYDDTTKEEASPSPNSKPTSCSNLIYKLRWANIGWFYHWGTKQYDFVRGKAPVDSSLKSICQQAVSVVDWSDIFQSDSGDWGDTVEDWTAWKNSYEPDAGIVNFYQTKDTLMAHVDRSEINATSPLVSISLGNAAVFLIGGLTRDTEPTAIILRSGDVVIMSGPSCRRAYHGVPRILSGTLPPHLSMDFKIKDWEPYAAFMSTTRININVRQVFPQGFDPAMQREG